MGMFEYRGETATTMRKDFTAFQLEGVAEFQRIENGEVVDLFVNFDEMWKKTRVKDRFLLHVSIPAEVWRKFRD